MSLGGSQAQKPDCSTVIYGIWEVGPTAMNMGHKSEACGEPWFGLAQLGHAPAMCPSTLRSIFQSIGSLSWNITTSGGENGIFEMRSMYWRTAMWEKRAWRADSSGETFATQEWGLEFRWLGKPASRLSQWGQGGRERMPGARCLARLEEPVSPGFKGDTRPQCERWGAME